MPEAVSVVVEEGVLLSLPVCVPEGVAVGVAVMLPVAELLAVPETLAVKLLLPLDVSVPETLALALEDAVLEGVLGGEDVPLGVPLLVLLPLPLCEGVGVTVAVTCAESDALLVALELAVGV